MSSMFSVYPRNFHLLHCHSIPSNVRIPLKALSLFLCLASSLTSNIVPQALPRQDKEQGGPLHVRCKPLPAQDRDLPVPGTALPPRVGVYSRRVNFYLSKIAYPGHSGPPSFLSRGLPRGVYPSKIDTKSQAHTLEG